MAKTPRLSADERRWRAESALSTLTQADRIRSDPKLMADVRKHASQQVKTLTKVTGSAPKASPKRK